jgi:hypothetical protein
MKKLTVLAVAMMFAGSLLGQTIYDVQFNDSDPGSGDDCYPSPYFEDEVTITGVVTAVMEGDYPDFWLQEKSGDLWAGVFVYDVSVDPSVGDTMTLTAEVDEYFGLTEVKYVSDFEIHGTADLPDVTDISTEDLSGGCNDVAEQYEGMLVRVTNVVVTQEPNSYGEWYVMDDSEVECQIDDIVAEYSYEPTEGDTISYIVGVVHYSYGEYEINPRGDADIMGIQESGLLPVGGSYALHGVSPNPARGMTEIAYEMARPGLVSLKVYNANGQLVRALFDGRSNEGAQTFVWNTDDLDAGVYFVSMVTQGFEATRPIVIAR